MVLNESPIKFGELLPKLGQLPFDDFKLVNIPDVYLKNIRHGYPIEEIIQPYRYVHHIMDRMMMEVGKKRRFIFFDIKIQTLQTGQSTCNGLWHLDSSLNDDFEFENFLFTFSDSLWPRVDKDGNFSYNVIEAATTEFLGSTMEVPVGLKLNEFHRKVREQTNGDDDVAIFSIPQQRIIKYNGKNIHRGPVVKQPQKRLLIRCISTDKRLPTSTEGLS